MLRLSNIFLYNVRESSVAALSGLEKGLAIKNSKSKYKCKSVNFKSQSKFQVHEIQVRQKWT